MKDEMTTSDERQDTGKDNGGDRRRGVWPDCMDGVIQKSEMAWTEDVSCDWIFRPVCEWHSVCITFTLCSTEDVVVNARVDVHVVTDVAEEGQILQSPAPQVGQ